MFHGALGSGFALSSDCHWKPIQLSKIWDFHGGDYEECRLLGYKNTVRTSQETLHLRYRV
jgi:hypothetical protein